MYHKYTHMYLLQFWKHKYYLAVAAFKSPSKRQYYIVVVSKRKAKQKQLNVHESTAEVIAWSFVFPDRSESGISTKSPP